MSKQKNKLQNNSNDVKKWINSLPPGAFINKSKKYFIDPTFYDELPLLPYNEQQWKKLFNPPPNNDYTKLQMTSVGTYSIGQPDINRELVRFILSRIEEVGLNKDTVTITETNGGLGGFSSALLTEFNTLNIMEINPTHYKIIQNNLKIYGFDDDPNKKITIYEDDYLQQMLNLNQDIIVSDPPWSGRDYIKQSAIRLGFSNIDISNVINFLNDNKKFKLFIFLAPVNFNFNIFLSQIRTYNIYIHKVRRHNFICIYGNE
jgi:hypothetical protein